MNDTQTQTTVVTIISIWSKAPEIGRPNNVSYDVEVPSEATETATLENAFMLTNGDDRPNGNGAYATTSGDIMVINGNHYLVQRDGFRKLTETESTKIQALTSRDTSFGFDFMVKHNILVL